MATRIEDKFPIKRDWDTKLAQSLAPPVTLTFDWRTDGLYIVVQWRDGSRNDPIIAYVGDGSRAAMHTCLENGQKIGRAMLELDK